MFEDFEFTPPRDGGPIKWEPCPLTPEEICEEPKTFPYTEIEQPQTSNFLEKSPNHSLKRKRQESHNDNINVTHDGESRVIFINDLLFIQNTEGVFELFDDIVVCCEEKERIIKRLCFYEIRFD